MKRYRTLHAYESEPKLYPIWIWANLHQNVISYKSKVIYTRANTYRSQPKHIITIKYRTKQARKLSYKPGLPFCRGKGKKVSKTILLGFKNRSLRGNHLITDSWINGLMDSFGQRFCPRDCRKKTNLYFLKNTVMKVLNTCTVHKYLTNKIQHRLYSIGKPARYYISWASISHKSTKY